ncbi:response regulator [Desulfobacterota bacterium M19]
MQFQGNLQYRLSPLTGEFTSSATEKTFTAERWPFTTRQIRLNSAIGALAYIAALSTDYSTFSWGHQTQVMAVMRLTVSLFAALIYFLTYQDHSSDRIGILIFLLELIISLSELIEYRYFFKYGSTSQMIDTPFIVVFILIFYAAVPNRAYFTITASLISSALFMGFRLYALPFSLSNGTVELGLMLLAVNAFGYTILLSSNRQSRNIFHQRALLEKEITERKLAESAAQQARVTAEQANMAKSRFMAIMNHELRTPLNGVLGGVQLLEGMSMAPKQHEILKIVSHSGDQLAALIEDVLDLARIEAGDILLNRQTFNLPRLLDDIQTIMTIQVRDKGLHLKLYLDDDLPTLLVGYPARLRQVLINLVGNAIKFTDTGEVSMTVRNISTDSSQFMLEFSIADSGLGISDADKKLIFESFSQVDNSDTRSHTGSGLGLAISLELVAAMGGELQVTSKIDVGSRFYFSLNFALGKEKSLPEMGVELPQLSLLLVDDSKANRRIAGGLLEKLGQLVTYAKSGEHAVSLATTTRFDLVFMDLHMPGINGIEATRRIHSEQPNVPIVAMTADVLKEKIQDCLNKGMAGFVPKPVRSTHLLDCLLKMSGQYSIQDDRSTEHTGQAADQKEYPLLDLELISDIREHLSENKVAEIIIICRETLEEFIDICKRSHERDGAGLDSETVHGLTGIAGNYGMVRLHQCAKKLELVIARNDLEKQMELEQDIPPLIKKSLKKWEQSINSGLVEKIW